MDREDARAKESKHGGRQGAGGKSREPREHRKRSAVMLHKGIPAGKVSQQVAKCWTLLLSGPWLSGSISFCVHAYKSREPQHLQGSRSMFLLDEQFF